MSIVAVPAGLIAPAEVTIGQARYDLTESSDSTGAEAARLLGPPRWKASLRSVATLSPAEAGLWEAMLLQLRGRVNHLALHDFARPVPAGSLRGAPTLAAAAAGAATISIATVPGATLQPGDWLQLGSGVGTSQLVKIVAPATAPGTGVLAVPIEPPLRIAFAAGTPVVWSRPVGYYKQTSDPGWQYSGGAGDRRQGGFVLDLLESWS